MTPAWTAIEAAMDELLSLPPAARIAAVKRVAGANGALEAELISLLGHVDSCGFLDRPVIEMPPDDGPQGSLSAGEAIGAYRVVRLLGHGGMGEVYFAARADGQFEQSVAVKLLRHEAVSHLQRFNTERQILAQLDHPGIARLLDGGVAADGRPYMIMELVIGQCITDWCETRRAPLAERLRLFIEVCDAVAYAHQNLVIHRDLKPGNVMVSDGGAVKLLDFGVAKLLSTLNGVVRDETGNAPLSLNYAAPEQLTSGHVTTAADIYALGALLHELLTGHSLWQISHLPMAVGLQAVLSRTPPRPSEAAMAQPRTAVPAKLLRGDLDAIVSKALRKEPQQRYETVSALRDDVRLHIAMDPINARQGVRLYVFGRVLRRYRVAVAVAAILVTLIVAGAAAVAWQAEHAARQARRADATRDFLVNVFRASDPKIASDKPRGQITAKELLDASAEHIGQKFADDPETELQLLRVTARIYSDLGEGKRAAELRKQRVDLARKLHGEASPDVIDASLEEVLETIYAEKYADANRMLDRSDRLLHEAGLDHSALRARWWNLKGSALWDRSDARQERVAAFSNAIALFASTAPQDDNYPTALNNRAVEAASAGQWNDAAAFYERALAVYDSSKERDDANVGGIKTMYGIALEHIGQFEAAERTYREAASLGLRTHGDQEGVYWQAVANHAVLIHALGARERADQMFVNLLPHIPDNYSASSDNAYVYEYYGNCLEAEGRAEEGVVFLERAEKIFRESPMDEYDLPRVQRRLGNAYDRAGRPEDARRTLKAAYDKRVASSAPDLDNLLDIRERWGRFLLAHGNPTDAASEFNIVLREAHARSLAPIALAHGDLAMLAMRDGNSELALHESDMAIAVLDNVKGLYDVRLYPYLWLIQARALLLSGNVPAARVEAQRALTRSLELDAPTSSAIQEARSLVTAISGSVGKDPI